MNSILFYPLTIYCSQPGKWYFVFYSLRTVGSPDTKSRSLSQVSCWGIRVYMYGKMRASQQKLKVCETGLYTSTPVSRQSGVLLTSWRVVRDEAPWRLWNLLMSRFAEKAGIDSNCQLRCHTVIFFSSFLAPEVLTTALKTNWWLRWKHKFGPAIYGLALKLHIPSRPCKCLFISIAFYFNYSCRPLVAL